MRFHAVRIGIVAAVAGTALWGGSGIASAGGGCMHSTGPTTGRGDTVELSDMCFTATVLYVKRGTEVTWTNRDPMEHDVVGVGGTWGDPDLPLLQGDSVSYRFAEDGVFPYACWIHPGMIGAIVVGDGVGSGLAGVVPGTATDTGSAASTDVSARTVGDGNVDPAVIWIVGAALLLAGMGGALALVARNRRKGALAG
jgi:plastocyanin